MRSNRSIPPSAGALIVADAGSERQPRSGGAITPSVLVRYSSAEECAHGKRHPDRKEDHAHP